MTLNETVTAKLAEWRPAASERSTLAIPDAGAGWTVAVSADRNDELGCMVWELSLRRAGAAAAGVTLATWAERAAAHVTGLLEPLKLLEVDAQRQEAQLRSQKPSERGQALYYYEVLLKGTSEALLRRFQASHETGKPRTQVAFPMTHESLARVVADLAAAG